MGRDFSIGGVESTVKPVSHVMFRILKEYDYFKNDKDHDLIKMKDLASAIYNLVPYKHKVKEAEQFIKDLEKVK